MTFPAPKQGLVIRYAFLWSHEQDAGADEASKDRPCAIVVATSLKPGGEIQVIVSPITHERPDDPDASIEISRAVCRSLGLDDGKHWLRLEELNRFTWPGFDLRPIPGRGGDVAYGMLLQALFEALRNGILARQANRKMRIQRR
ncbi:MAG: hypothetical protein WDM85_06155 [Caulobacteraceae bacterium]